LVGDARGKSVVVVVAGGGGGISSASVEAVSSLGGACTQLVVAGAAASLVAIFGMRFFRAYEERSTPSACSAGLFACAKASSSLALTSSCCSPVNASRLSRWQCFLDLPCWVSFLQRERRVVHCLGLREELACSLRAESRLLLPVLVWQPQAVATHPTAPLGQLAGAAQSGLAAAARAARGVAVRGVASPRCWRG